MPLSANWKELLAEWAAFRGWTYQAEGNQAVFNFSDGPGGRGLNMSIAASSDWLAFRMTDDRYLDEKDLPVAVAAANLWNGNYHLPNAIVIVPEDGGQAYIDGRFIADICVDYDFDRFTSLANAFFQFSLDMFDYFSDKYAL